MSVVFMNKTLQVLTEVLRERQAQIDVWGTQNLPDGTGGPYWIFVFQNARDRSLAEYGPGQRTWQAVLFEEVTEAFIEPNPARLRHELIQVAAVAVQWVEAIDRRGGREK